MLPKPVHLGPQYAAQFTDASVAAAYPHRPAYPAEIFEILAGLLTDAPRVVLDAGCGTGDLARHLVRFVDRVDAVDPSAAMVALGRTLPGGSVSNLHWTLGTIEQASLKPPYALITAGESLHWMDWAVTLPRFRAARSPAGYLAIASRDTPDLPWADALLQLIQRSTTNREFQPYNLVTELEIRGLFRVKGTHRTAPLPFEQSVDAYIESIHSRNGFSRDRMTKDAAAAFDAAVRSLLALFSHDDMLRLQVVGNVVWGKPQSPYYTA